MKLTKITAIILTFFAANNAAAQQAPAVKKTIVISKTAEKIKIDGVFDEPAWKTAGAAKDWVTSQPAPFMPEIKGDESETYFLYDNEGIYIAGYMHENKKDSIAAELTGGRDGFGNNDFFGVIFDTYEDKLNGFEYFVTPLNEQWDAKTSPASGEDFAWNAVWQSAVKINADGWSFEMFIPYSAIRFGNKKVQNWGLNLVRKRMKGGNKIFWQSIDPNVNGFLTQEGTLAGFENIKPPLRLQFSPYFSTYYNHDDNAEPGIKKSKVFVNGGMDVKYGINQAFTLDMTLIPDFGQVQTDNRTLNLTPFEQKFAENRSFFTEGTELFNKGNLFYSRRIGGEPIHYWDAYGNANSNEIVAKNPIQSKLVNATKISGRTQSGLGIGILNAVTKPQYAIIENDQKGTRKFETDPLTNYNVLVLNQSLKHNSSISLVNTNVWRSGPDREANVTAGMIDLNDKSNTWNVGGAFNMSNIISKGKSELGYSHNIYFGKTSGRFNFNVYQDLMNAKFDKSDMGYATNNNYVEEGLWTGYSWNKPKNWYNNMHLNFNYWYNTLVTPMDLFKGKDRMYQNTGLNVNGNAQTKKLWYAGFSFNKDFAYNDFYEARTYGRTFRNKGAVRFSPWFESNSAKKFSGGASFVIGAGGVFNRTTFNYNFFSKYRFSNKFSIDNSLDVTHNLNQAGWASTIYTGNPATDTVIFSRRNMNAVENILNLKYSFSNKMGLTIRARHSWTKVTPLQFYQLDKNGDLQTPDRPFTGNVNQNYNFFSVDAVYNWQFAQGSFITLAWKDIGENFNRTFEKNYIRNLTKIIDGNQFNSLSLRVIYFLDYVTMRNKMKARRVNG